nr:PREDICTED: retinitis pigmentosa 1-like 1 protein [Latimeria chalumnae]|eukprot:XP_006003043.1 PREDICTED: retinitis pigmentosa 1-like 1 protein [Latimeria chalumnae]
MTEAPANPPSHEQPLPPVTQAAAHLVEVTPAKKITFFKSGDPQFNGVRMAVNRRTFKSFNALLDDLSQRVPLAFGVRTITTPRGTRCIDRLEQLEDGACYLCSDKRHVKAAGARPPAPWQNRSKASRSGKRQASPAASVSHAHLVHKTPKKIMLVKNGEADMRHTVVLNRRNTYTFKTFLDEVSDLMQCSVKKLCTLEGRKVDTIQALLHCPRVLVCMGREPFKPVLAETLRHGSVEKLPGLATRSRTSIVGESVESRKNVKFGLETKKSVIHPRSSSSNRSLRFSLSSEKSYPHGLNSGHASFMDSCSHSKHGNLAHSIVNDDIEKRVHVNKDGSLSVEMKVRFRLLNEETLQWSTQIKKSSLYSNASFDQTNLAQEEVVDPIHQMDAGVYSEGDDSFYPCDADDSYISKLNEELLQEMDYQQCCNYCREYDIWKNSMHKVNNSDRDLRSRRSACSCTSSHRRLVCKKSSVESMHTASSDEYAEHFVQQSASYSETFENGETRVEYCSVSRCSSQSAVCTSQPSTACSQGSSSISSLSNVKNPVSLETQAFVGEEQGQVEESPVSNISESSLVFKPCKESKDENEGVKSKSVASSSSSVKCKDPVASPNYLHPRPESCASSSTTHCNKEKDTEDIADHSEGERANSSISKCSQSKCGLEKVDARSISTMSPSSKRSHNKEPINQEDNKSERLSMPGSSSSEDHARIRETKAKDTDSKDRDLSSLSHSSKHNKGSTPQKESAFTLLNETRSSASVSSKSSCENAKNSRADLRLQHSNSHHSVQSSVSEDIVESNLKDEEQKPTSSASKNSGNSINRKKVQTEDEERPSTSGSSSSKPSLNDDVKERARQSKPSKSKLENLKEGRQENKRHHSVSSSTTFLSKFRENHSDKEECEANRSKMNQHNMTQSLVLEPNLNKETNSVLETSRSSCVSDSASICCSQCPSPPKGKPHAKKVRPVTLKCSPKSNVDTDPVSAVQETKEELVSSAPTTSGSKSRVSVKINNEKDEKYEYSKSASDSKSGKEMAKVGSVVHKKNKREKPEVTGELITLALPNTSPEEVVNEWLQKMPSDTVLMKYIDLQDCDQVGMKEFAKGMERKGKPLEPTPTEEEELSQNKKVGSCSSTREVQPNTRAQKYVLEDQDNKQFTKEIQQIHTDCKHATISSCQHIEDLPKTIISSVQIMKVLLNPRQGAHIERSNSLPEVSPTLGKKLSNAAKALLMCLASLQLFDEEPLDTRDQPDHVNKLKYKELLNILQSLWLGEAAKNDQEIPYQKMILQQNKPASLKSCQILHSTDDEFTPVSSSGVDVSSGSGRSGDGSVAGAADMASTTKKRKDHVPTLRETDTDTNPLPPDSHDENKSNEKGVSSRPETSSPKPDLSASSYRNGIPDQACHARWSSGEQSSKDEVRLAVDKNMNKKSAEISDMDDESAYVTPQKANMANQALPPADHENEGQSDHASENQTEAPTDNNTGEEDTNNTFKSVQPGEYFLQDKEPIVREIVDAAEKEVSDIQRNLPDSDPGWVVKLLKKIEKEFMTHYVDAMNDFKCRWNLVDDERLDEMISDLKDEVSKRLQASIKKELKKLKGQAGQRPPRPPEEPAKREFSFQTEQRRRRLKKMLKNPAVNELNMTPNGPVDSSFEKNYEDLTFSSTLENELVTQPNDEEYCPCDTCMQKKMAARPARATVAASAPVIKDFDLRQILRMKKDNVNETNEDAKPDADEGKHELAEAAMVPSVCAEIATEKEPDDIKAFNQENLEDQKETQDQSESNSGQGQTAGEISEAPCWGSEDKVFSIEHCEKGETETTNSEVGEAPQSISDVKKGDETQETEVAGKNDKDLSECSKQLESTDNPEQASEETETKPAEIAESEERDEEIKSHTGELEAHEKGHDEDNSDIETDQRVETMEEIENLSPADQGKESSASNEEQHSENATSEKREMNDQDEADQSDDGFSIPDADTAGDGHLVNNKSIENEGTKHPAVAAQESTSSLGSKSHSSQRDLAERASKEESKTVTEINEKATSNSSNSPESKPAQMYPESSSEDSDSEDEHKGPSTNIKRNNTVVHRKIEDVSDNKHENSTINSEKPDATEVEQDDLDF